MRMPGHIELTCEEAAQLLVDMGSVDQELAYRTLIQGLGDGRVAIAARQTDWNLIRMLADGDDDPASKRVAAFIRQHAITDHEGDRVLHVTDCFTASDLGFETRMMDWSSESELLNELRWLSEGTDTILQPDGTNRPLTAEEVAVAAHAFELLLAQEHDEPERDEDRPDEPPVAVTLPTETWVLIDALCVGVDFGWGVGVVGMRPEVA
jgi:hypothetical protein